MTSFSIVKVAMSNADKRKMSTSPCQSGSESTVQALPARVIENGNHTSHGSADQMRAHVPDELIRRQQFDALVEKNEKRLFNAVYRMINDYEEAADITQETFVNAFRHFDHFRGDSQVFTWLYQIARNLCINRIRQQERHRSIRTESLHQIAGNQDSLNVTRDIPDSSSAPHQLLEDQELQQRILAAVNALPTDYREIVLLREYQQLSYNEIVDVTGLSLENVKTRLSRARGMLRKKLEPYLRN